MRGFPIAAAAWLMNMACAGSESEGDGATTGPSSSGGGMAEAGMAEAGMADAARTETLPLTPGEPAMLPEASANAPSASPYVAFTDTVTGFITEEVHDADREIVRFDASLDAMVSAASGDSVGGWTVEGAELDWARSGVAFRVRFGTEAGERRAFFTEAGPGTICNLNVVGPDVLFISATRETPPNP